MDSSSVLVIDVGTSGVRALTIDPDSNISNVCYEAVLPNSPMPGFVEFDPLLMANAALRVANAALAKSGPVCAVGIANQRASTIVWERRSGNPVGPGIGWQDLRTVGTCLSLREDGFRVAPNMSATKLAFLLGLADQDSSKDLCFGTVDTWIAWNLSQGSVHVTDATNAGVTGLWKLGSDKWDDDILEKLNISESILPRIVNSSEIVGQATSLPGAPPICGIAGDQQASLIGQGCTTPGIAKITFGTGGMLDTCTGSAKPEFEVKGPNGTFPIVAWKRNDSYTWGIEAVMLSAGSCIEWLRDDLQIISTAKESEAVASQCPSTGEVFFVPALLGLGTPEWDLGARGTLLGITRGTQRPQIVRAVLEGIAQRGADLVEAAEADCNLSISTLRVDGGMSSNEIFLKALADATGHVIEVSPVLEATTLGAAYLAGMACSIWEDEEDIAGTWEPGRVIEPTLADRKALRESWRDCLERSKETVPGLSSLEF